jgi:hypothetical protein
MVIKYWKRSSGRAVIMAAIVITLAGAAWVASTPAQTQDSDLQDVLPLTSTTPFALFQFSTLTGSGDTMTATDVPVVTSTGSIIYKNVTAQFNVDSAGNLTLAKGFPKVVSASPPPFNSFEAGKYAGPGTLGNGKFAMIVGGPTVSPGGTTWGATVATGADPNTYPFSCSWYDGPIANNPDAPRLEKVGITSTALSYGVCSGPCPAVNDNPY